MSVLHHNHNRANMYGLARHAEHYDRWAGRLARPLYRRVVADVAAAGLPSGAVVLDVGTGPGRVPLMIAATCPELSVTGIDLSTEMITKARAHATTRPDGGGQLSFRVADVAELPFDDGSVDLVVSSISMHHWENPAAGLRDVVRVLRPGGQAWVYDARPMIRRGAEAAVGIEADLSVECPVPGTRWFNPIGRLVLRRP